MAIKPLFFVIGHHQVCSTSDGVHVSYDVSCGYPRGPDDQP